MFAACGVQTDSLEGEAGDAPSAETREQYRTYEGAADGAISFELEVVESGGLAEIAERSFAELLGERTHRIPLAFSGANLDPHFAGVEDTTWIGDQRPGGATSGVYRIFEVTAHIGDESRAHLALETCRDDQPCIVLDPVVEQLGGVTSYWGNRHVEGARSQHLSLPSSPLQTVTQLNSSSNSFSTNSPRARLVETNLDFLSNTWTRWAFKIDVLRSSNSLIKYRVINSCDTGDRNFYVVVDGQPYGPYVRNSTHELEVAVGSLGLGTHWIGVEFTWGGNGGCWKLDYLEMANGNYRLAEQDVNIAESKVETGKVTYGTTCSGWLCTEDKLDLSQETRVDAPGAFIYTGSSTGSSQYRIYAGTTNRGTQSSGYWCHAESGVERSTILLYARIVDNPSIQNGSTWLSLHDAHPTTSTSQEAQKWSWQISASAGMEYAGVSASVAPVVTSDRYSDETLNAAGGTYDSWRYLGKAWADFHDSPAKTSKFSVYFDVIFANGNAGNWDGHNIQFKVLVHNRWRAFTSCTGSWRQWEHVETSTHIIGDGVGGVGTNTAETDRWLTVWPGSAGQGTGYDNNNTSADVCGDGSCTGNESCSTCATDCGTCRIVCGDNVCNGTETCDSCPSDCGVCSFRSCASFTEFPGSAVHIDYSDDQLQKELVLDFQDLIALNNAQQVTSTHLTIPFRWNLQLMGKAFSGDSRTTGDGIRVYVNGTQVCEFFPHALFDTTGYSLADVCSVTGTADWYPFSGNQSVRAPFRKGSNTILLKTSSSWTVNGTWVGLDTGNDCDQSAWENGSGTYLNPADNTGELMITHEITAP